MYTKKEIFSYFELKTNVHLKINTRSVTYVATDTHMHWTFKQNILIANIGQSYFQRMELKTFVQSKNVKRCAAIDEDSLLNMLISILGKSRGYLKRLLL